MKNRNGKELDKVCDLLASAFFNDPVLKFAFTNPVREQRMEIMRRFFSIYVNLARKHGGILLAENDAGVLVYFRPEMMDMTDKESIIITNQLRQECGLEYVSIAALMNGLNHYHPRNPPHYYVFAIAVQGAFRRKGVATGLLAELNTMLDRVGFPCYSECTTLGTKSLFMQSGYCGTKPPLLIEGFPMLFPVWREPKETGGYG